MGSYYSNYAHSTRWRFDYVCTRVADNKYTVSWSLHVERTTSGSIRGDCCLYINNGLVHRYTGTAADARANQMPEGAQYTVKRSSLTQGQWDSGSFDVGLDGNGNGSFTVSLTSHIYTGAWNAYNVSFSTQTESLHYHTGATAGSLSIRDNGNNSFTISAGAGTNGANNAILGLYNLGYRYSPTAAWTNWYYEANNNGNDTASNKAVSATISFSPSGTADTRTVYYRAYWDAVQVAGEDNPHKSSSANIKQYIKPGDPGKPVIEYTKSRLTIKEPWTISWYAAQAGNSNSPISGYRLRIYKNGLPIDIKNSSGTVVSVTVGADKYYDMSGTSYVINPSSHGILPGDKISIALFAYAFNGAGTRLWSGNEENAVLSDVYTVQNAGVMRPLVDGKHVEGVVWACIPDSTTNSKIRWVEADIVKTAIKDSSTNSIKWVEGE